MEEIEIRPKDDLGPGIVLIVLSPLITMTIYDTAEPSLHRLQGNKYFCLLKATGSNFNSTGAENR